VIRVLLVDDQALVRAGLRVLLEGEDDIVVVGEADDGGEAAALARRTKPDVVLMDISMPGIGGLAATREVVADKRLANARVLILTTFESDENLFEALRSGASGFLVKDTEPAELLRAIRVIAQGDALLSPNVTRRLIAEFASRPKRCEATAEQLEWLTEREREVMALVAAGLSNHEIARELVISSATAKTHVSRAMRKLHAHDRAQLVVFAYASGLVVPGPAATAGVERSWL
jgi:DNA-binding NarL/FixJ family response regulator